METKLVRIAEISATSKHPIFTSVYHLINEDMLKQCHKELDGNKAVGIDKVTKDEYGKNLDRNIKELVQRLKNKSFKPLPSLRVYIPKGNGKKRPLLNMDEKGDDAIGMDDDAAAPEKPQEDVKSVDKKGEEVADMPVKQSNLGKSVTDGKLSDRPAQRTSLQERLAAMKARVSGTPAGRDAVDKAKGKDQIL